ncbi:MAG: hypothetical protein K0R57_4865 [Paenibacillaceae bacterium]|jgi:hypothetical protein|nr:hypothetical protein [Paenibacillaceae bacterium]
MGAKGRLEKLQEVWGDTSNGLRSCKKFGAANATAREGRKVRDDYGNDWRYAKNERGGLSKRCRLHSRQQRT